MTTDITELAQSLKAAAEKLDGDNWHDEGASVYGEAYDVGDHVCYDLIADCENVNGESLVAEFISLANPANILVLVEALEKAQQERDEFRNRLKLERSILEDADKRIAELEDAEQKLCAANVTLDARAELAERQLAELESRTVTVKQFDEFQICHYGATEDYAKGYIDCQNNFFKWLNTAGIKWEAE